MKLATAFCFYFGGLLGPNPCHTEQVPKLTTYQKGQNSIHFHQPQHVREAMFMWFCWPNIPLLDSIAKCNMVTWQCLEPKATCPDAIDFFLSAPFAVGCDSAAKQRGEKSKKIYWKPGLVNSDWGMVWGCCCKSCFKLRGFYPKKSLGTGATQVISTKTHPPNVQPTRKLKVSNRKGSNHHPNLCTYCLLKTSIL